MELYYGAVVGQIREGLADVRGYPNLDERDKATELAQLLEPQSTIRQAALRAALPGLSAHDGRRSGRLLSLTLRTLADS